MPAARGLFHRALIQSGAPIRVPNRGAVMKRVRRMRSLSVTARYNHHFAQYVVLDFRIDNNAGGLQKIP